MDASCPTRKGSSPPPSGQSTLSTPPTAKTASWIDSLPRASQPRTVVLGIPGQKPASNYGSGTVEIKEVIGILERAGICSCVVGISALKYYGAWRVRHEWEICVPTHLLDKAARIFSSAPHNQIYESSPLPEPRFRSLFHTFPRFKMRGVWLHFIFVPAEDAHVDCIPDNIEYSQMDIPYPNLPVFAQSLLDMNDAVALADLIDGMDLSGSWGSENLNLTGTTDIAWTMRKNQKIRESALPTEDPCFLGLPDRPQRRRELWQALVSTKENRMGVELPKGYYYTRFYPYNQGDPRLTPDRKFC